MANQEHLALLKQGAGTWNTWRAKQAGNPDLSGADLREADLWNANLRGTIFRQAKVLQTDLNSLHLTENQLKELTIVGSR